MTRRRALNDDEAEALYQDYCRWLEARRNWHPKKLMAKYGVCRETFARYTSRKAA